MERGYEHRLSNRCLSPLRYPGGKAKITQFIANVLDTNKITGTYIEPFAGGAGVALNLLYAGKVNSIIINDLDDGVYSFWKTATNEPGYLTNKIKKVPFSYGESNNPEVLSSYWKVIKKRYETNRYRDTRLKAFDFLMLNRMNVSGIINAGPIGGITQENSYDISARFNKQTLIERLELLYAYSDKIRVTNFEASHFLDLLSQGYFNTTSNSLVYLDPPYFNQGKKLYDCFAPYIVHSLIADKLLKAHWKWLITYDTAPQISKLYPQKQVQKFRYNIRYSANKKGIYQEYLFACHDLNIEPFSNVQLHKVTG